MSSQPPQTISPIEYNDLTITYDTYVTDQDHFVLFLQGKKKGTDEVIWKTNLYEVIRFPGLEGDAQDVFLSTLELSNGTVQAISENGDEFNVNPDTGEFCEGSAFKSLQNDYS